MDFLCRWHAEGPGICVMCVADTCASELHTEFNPVAPYEYMPPNMYLLMTYITNPDYLFNVVGRGLVSASLAFAGSSTSQSAGPHGRLAPKR